MKSLSAILVSALFVGLVGTSCSDMLEPNMERYSDKFAQDTVYSEFGILKSIQNIAERTVILDASRSDLVTTGTYTTDSIMNVFNFADPEDGENKLLNVADYYHIINSCNFYLAQVDTTVSKNGYQQMKREFAETQTIRAWAYLQLIQVYGEVPFVTSPVSSTADAAREMRTCKKISKSNVADLLLEAGMQNANDILVSLGLPDYQNISNGSNSYSTSQLFFPSQLVLGDAYLMQNQYQKAAEMYYNYFYRSSNFSDPMNATNNSTYNSSADRITRYGEVVGYRLNSGNWLRAFSGNAQREKLVVTVGAVSNNYGTVLKEIQHVYGFSTSSTYGSSSGSVSISANEEYQQLLPSQQYISLNQSQVFNKYSDDDDIVLRETIEGGDARLYATAPQVEYNGGNKGRVINKFCPTWSSISSLTSSYVSPNSFNMMYEVPLYRTPQVWLRYAEAINRMGFPQMAFAVLKDGLARENLPTLSYKDMNRYIVKNVVDEETGKTVKDTIGVVKTVIGEDGVAVNDSLYYADGATPNPDSLHVAVLTAPTALNGGCYYVGVKEMEEAQKYPLALDFKTPSKFSSNDLTTKGNYYGIHGRGCGDVGGTRDTIYTYAKMVSKKLAETYARENGLSYAEQLAYEETLHKGDTLLLDETDPTVKAAIIDAVENLLIDEGALETAFEGSRFADLMRVASHKTEAGKDGTSWLAWKVARRDYNVTDNAAEYDQSIFSKLSNQKNWYLSLPE